MEVKKIEFDRKKYSDSMKFSNDFITDINLKIGQESTNVFLDIFTANLEAYFYSVEQEKELTYYLERPSFFDWLFRRRKEVKVLVNCHDVLKNPPQGIDTHRILTVTKNETNE